jgi:hypothetical protein
MDDGFVSYAKRISMEDGGRTDKDDRFSVEQSTIAKIEFIIFHIQ